MKQISLIILILITMSPAQALILPDDYPDSSCDPFILPDDYLSPEEACQKRIKDRIEDIFRKTIFDQEENSETMVVFNLETKTDILVQKSENAKEENWVLSASGYYNDNEAPQYFHGFYKVKIRNPKDRSCEIQGPIETPLDSI